MRRYILLLLLSLSTIGCHEVPSLQDSSPPAELLGQFLDDYGIEYTITKQTWTMMPEQKFHILQWNPQEQYLLARNDTENASDQDLFTRIDYMIFDHQQKPYRWGFCMSAFDAKSRSQAEKIAIADRAHPKTGCNGFPFSRMKPKKTEHDN